MTPGVEDGGAVESRRIEHHEIGLVGEPDETFLLECDDLVPETLEQRKHDPIADPYALADID